MSVFSFQDAFGFCGNHLISLSCKHVEYSLSTYDLAGRSYERRITEVFSYIGNFGKHLFVFIESVSLFKLTYEVGKHTAGNLIDKCVYVGSKRLFGKPTVCLESVSNLLEVVGYLIEICYVESGIVLCTLEDSNHRLGSRLRSTVTQSTESTVDNIYACFDSFEISLVTDTCGLVSVQVNQSLRLQNFLHTLYKVVSGIRKENTGHIFDTNVISTHIFELLCEFDEIFVGMNGAGGVRNRSLAYTAVFFTALYSLLHISGVVKSVENTENVTTVFDSFLYELIYYVVGIVLVSKDVLSSEKHLKFCFGHSFSERSQSLPGVLVKESKARVESSAAPTFY